MRFAVFPLHLSKVLRRSYEVLHLSRKIILANLKIWCSKMQPLSGNQRPDLLTSLMNMSLALRLPHHMHLCRSSSNVPLTSFLEKLQNHPVLLTFGKVQNPLRLQRKATSEPSKVVWASGGFNVLTWKCALHHNSVHFFNISTSKSAPKPSDIWLRNVLHATKWRALFRHRSFQKCSETVSKCASRHTTACTFSTSQLPKVLRRWCALCISTWKCASRHNGVQFFISHLASWLRTRRFSEPTFRPSGATNHWKNAVFRDFVTF